MKRFVHFGRSLELNPESAPTQYNLASRFALRGRRDEAVMRVSRSAAPRSRLRAGAQQPCRDAAARRPVRRGAGSLSPRAGAQAGQRRGPGNLAQLLSRQGRSAEAVAEFEQRAGRQAGRSPGAERARVDSRDRRRRARCAIPRQAVELAERAAAVTQPPRPRRARCPRGGVCRSGPVRRGGGDGPGGRGTGSRGRPGRYRRPVQGAAGSLSKARGLPGPAVIAKSFSSPFAFYPSAPSRLPAFPLAFRFAL